MKFLAIGRLLALVYGPQESGSRPQHLSVPSRRMPQLCVEPTETWTNCTPVGGVASPPLLVPQQAIEPSSRSAQALTSPTLISRNGEAGGMRFSAGSSNAQHCGVPSKSSPHANARPTLTCLKGPLVSLRESRPRRGSQQIAQRVVVEERGRQTVQVREQP